jgi:hypothetical protein
MLTLDISGDFEIFDNTEVVTIKNANEDAVTIDNVKRQSAMLGTDLGGSSIVYGAAIEFQIWKSSVQSLYFVDGEGNQVISDDLYTVIDFGGVDFIPRLNARITDKFGKHYRVDSIEDMAWRTKWSLKATSEASEGTN